MGKAGSKTKTNHAERIGATPGRDITEEEFLTLFERYTSRKGIMRKKDAMRCLRDLTKISNYNGDVEEFMESMKKDILTIDDFLELLILFNMGKAIQGSDIEAVIGLAEEESDKNNEISIEEKEEEMSDAKGEEKKDEESKEEEKEISIEFEEVVRQEKGREEKRGPQRRRKKKKRSKEKKKEEISCDLAEFSNKIQKLEKSLNDSLHEEEIGMWEQEIEQEPKGKENKGEKEEKEKEEEEGEWEWEEDEKEDWEEEEEFRWGGLSLSGRESDFFENEEAYSILTTQDVYEIMQQKAKEAGEIFELPTATAVQVLSRIQWNISRIAEAESVESFLAECGVCPSPPCHPPSFSPSPSPSSTPPSSYSCCVCFDEDLGAEEVFALGCGHTSCRECWGNNISTALNKYWPNEIQCPGKDCTYCLLEDHILFLGGEKEYLRYKEQTVETFIQNNQRLLYCNDPKCNLITEYRGWLQANSQIKCHCGAIFCFRCCKEKKTETGEGHFPATCKQYSRWLEKSEGGVYSFRKKPCPKCKASIIKCGCPANEVICSEKEYCPNQACNHMQCPMCGHHFCWVCLKNWSGHSDFYNCNFVVPEMVKNGELQGHYLQAYLKYKNCKENSLVFEYRSRAFKNIFGISSNSFPSSPSLVSSSSSTPSIPPSPSSPLPSSFSSFCKSVSNIEGVQDNFLTALEELAVCYHTLSNTYIMLYYVKEGDREGVAEDDTQVQLFEYKQAHFANLVQHFANKMDEVLQSTYSKSTFDQRQLNGFSAGEVEEFSSLTQIIHDYRVNLFSEEN